MLFFLFSFLLSVYSLNSTAPCGFGIINLSHLRSTADYVGLDTTNFNYYINICGAVNYPLCRSEFPDSTMCQVVKGVEDCKGQNCNDIANWESVNPPVWSYINSSQPDEGVVATYSNGGICSSTNKPYNVEITYMCSDKTSPTFIVNDKTSCSFYATMFVNCNPPSPSKSSAGKAVLIVFLIILCIFSVYFTCGLIINRIILDQRGVESIPHYAVWKACCNGLG